MASVGMFDSCITGHWFSQKAKDIWSDSNTIQSWLDVEAALALAQAKLGMIPKSAADIIAKKADVKLLDADKISAGIKETMHPFVPVLRQYEAVCGTEAASYIHWGATTQNIFDTGAVLQLRETHNIILSDLDNVLNAMAKLAADTKNIPQAGRTHGQHALPITFGFKVAGWRAEIRRHKTRLKQAAEDAFIVTMGGAVGVFSAMGGNGRNVQDEVAELLNLKSSSIPVRSSCDSLAAYINIFGLLAATVEKISEEVIFLQRTEIAEVEESFHHGKVGSSTMSQKRNPQHAQNLVGVSQLLRSRMMLANTSMIRMNEGDAAESNILDVSLPEVSIFAVSLVEGLYKLISGLNVYPENMKKNLNISGGLILSEAVMMQLAEHIGRPAAHHILYEAAMNSIEKKITFAESIHDELNKENIPDTLDINKILDPLHYLGESAECVDDELKK